VHLPNHTLLWACSLSGLWRLVFISPCELALGIMGSRNFALWPTIFWNLQISSLGFSGYGFDINCVFGFLLQHSIVWSRSRTGIFFLWTRNPLTDLGPCDCKGTWVPTHVTWVFDFLITSSSRYLKISESKNH
jgi:hypothetical protein